MNEHDPTLNFAPDFFVEDRLAFLFLGKDSGLKAIPPEIDQGLINGEILACALVTRGKEDLCSISPMMKRILLNWLWELSIPTVFVATKGHYEENWVELMMCCDIRLGKKELTMQFPWEVSPPAFDLEERCQVLMGVEGRKSDYHQLTRGVFGGDELYELGFFNHLLGQEDPPPEVKLFFRKIIGDKSRDQIKAIVDCFHYYKKLGLKTYRDLLLEEEARQFCRLAAREFWQKDRG